MSSRSDFSTNSKTDKDNNKDNSFLIYDYFDTNIYTPYEKDIEKNGYIKIPFQNSKSIIQPNLILPNNEKYKIENIYIYKKNEKKDIVKKEYDGELIIEHTPITNGKNKVYVCILLKSRTNISEDSDIDKMIKKTFSDKMNLNLNNFIENMNSSCLVNEENNIFIFKTPLLISSNFDNFSNIEKEVLPNFDVNELRIIQTKKMDSIKDKDSSIKEGFEDKGKDIYIDCNPVDSSDTTVSMVPVNSENLMNPSTVIFMSTIQNFFIFIILMIIISVSIPNIYKFILMEFVDKTFAEKRNKNKYLSTIDKIIMFVLFCISFITLIDGLSKYSKIQTSIGLFFFICFSLMVLIMTVLKIMNKDYYNFLDDFTNTATEPSTIDILLEVIKESLVYMFQLFQDGWNLLFLLILEGIFLLISHYGYNIDINDRLNSTYYVLLTIFTIYISVIIIRIFK